LWPVRVLVESRSRVPHHQKIGWNRGLWNLSSWLLAGTVCQMHETDSNRHYSDMTDYHQ
jgi:hypothetical protein